MNLVFIGPQGSGKGTQAKIISKELGLCHISTGDLLRNAKAELKEKINQIMNKGELVPDEIIINLIKEKISSEECKNGFILDGSPRNLNQAKEINKITKIDKAVEIYISDKEAINRITNRISCPSCGAIYNLKTNPPKQMTCEKCKTPLKKREDDTEESIKKRLEIYHKETEPIIKYYNAVKINGEQEIDKVKKDILKILQSI